MLHIITGSLQTYGTTQYICNEFFGIQVDYNGSQKKGNYFVFPLMDDNNKTIHYFAWDTQSSKDVFCKLVKISGIGPKTAFSLSNIDSKKLEQAVLTNSLPFFQSIPGIGPKTAKRLIIELKSIVKDQDLAVINGDDKVVKSIVSYCKGLGYDPDTVKELLGQYPGEISKKKHARSTQTAYGKNVDIPNL